MVPLLLDHLRTEMLILAQSQQHEKIFFDRFLHTFCSTGSFGAAACAAFAGNH